MVLTPQGVFAGARLPDCERLDGMTLQRAEAMARRWQREARVLPRGHSHAAICASFFAGGLKGDQDSRLAMPHSSVGGAAHESLSGAEAQKELQSFLRGVVLSRVEKYFAGLIDAPRDLLYSHGLRWAFVDYFTSATCGHLFWNRAHTDDDAWITILVALGESAEGGGFAHPSCGVVQEVRAGDIFVVNPAVSHCTTKFGDALANRRMIALFVSDNVLRACGTSAAVAKEEGLEVWRPRHKRKR